MLADAEHSGSADVRGELEAWLRSPSFSCLGARAALNQGLLVHSELGALASPEATAALHAALEQFVATTLSDDRDFATFVAVFDGPSGLSEERFEELLWRQLRGLHRRDRRNHQWAPDADADPRSARFALSVAGHPFFVVGLHDGASRASRRHRRPALVFNSHRQFRRLKATGAYAGLQRRIRARELALQGSVNPMLAEHGDVPEARQYSGRAVPPDWECPFGPRDPGGPLSSVQPPQGSMNERDTSAAVVTGASSGFGEAVVRRLVAEGRRVVAVARRLDRLDRLVADLGVERVLPCALDVRDAARVEAALSDLPYPFDDVGVLVNCAGLSKGFGPVQDAALDDWRVMVETNVMGHLHCVRAVLPRMLAEGHGHVVNIGSIAAVYPYTGGNVYGATKAFTHQLSLNLRTDLEGSGIRVTCIAPGMARTEFALVRFDGDEERADALYDGVEPLTGDDVADAVQWCLSQPSRINVNLIELMPTDQPFGLGFRAPVRSEATA